MSAPKPHECAWEGRPEGSTTHKQHYRCTICKRWAKRVFGRGKISSIIPYENGETFDTSISNVELSAEFYNTKHDESYRLTAEQLVKQGLSIVDEPIDEETQP